MTFSPGPVTLEGRLVRLEPLARAHVDAIVEAASDAEIFRWYPSRMDEPSAVRAWAETALAEQDSGASLPFATIERGRGVVVGSTRFGNVDRSNLRVEIGWTWLAPAWQRTGINREAKYLMLRHAFEVWGVRRVEFKTHRLNLRSRAALAALGATEEGTLRKHVVMPDGSARDSVYFSILDCEWERMKAALERRLGRS